jgi:hypothetical protein
MKKCICDVVVDEKLERHPTFQDFKSDPAAVRREDDYGRQSRVTKHHNDCTAVDTHYLLRFSVQAMKWVNNFKKL